MAAEPLDLCGEESLASLITLDPLAPAPIAEISDLSLFEEQSFLFVASCDLQGRPTASLLSGPAGSLAAHDGGRIVVRARALEVDALTENVDLDGPLALLAMGRGRLVMAKGWTRELRPTSFVMEVARSSARDLALPSPLAERQGFRTWEPPLRQGYELARSDQLAIERAGSFLAASACKRRALDGGPGVNLALLSAAPGALRIDGEGFLEIEADGKAIDLEVLSDFVMNPRCGLLFVDQVAGDLLQVQGQIAIDWLFPEREEKSEGEGEAEGAKEGEAPRPRRRLIVRPQRVRRLEGLLEPR